MAGLIPEDIVTSFDAEPSCSSAEEASDQDSEHTEKSARKTRRAVPRIRSAGVLDEAGWLEGVVGPGTRRKTIALVNIYSDFRCSLTLLDMPSSSHRSARRTRVAPDAIKKDSVMKDGMSMNAASKFPGVGGAETLRRHLIKAGFQPAIHHRKSTKEQIDAAVKDIVERHMSRNKACKRENPIYEKAVAEVTQNGASCRSTGKRFNIHPMTIKAGYSLPALRNRVGDGGRTQIKMAAQAVLDRHIPVRQAAMEFGADYTTVRLELTLRGFEYSKTKPSKWVKKTSKPFAVVNSSNVKPNQSAQKRTAQSESGETDMEEEEIDLPEPIAQEEVTTKGPNEGLGPRDSPEIERIVDVRQQRQYLVRWQGQTEEQATWVDEDVLLGLGALNIK
ncbi:hypothetical protein RvY_10861 [Ramazzottius varieornatus]|uniref:Chromo domain-containing protein n=1 Tax=Ramazzottius varieornatus TaxID=947166 RepID=A0A1D1VJK8_RAMVA|nr:hypothetical protein RvY_10861 [Ramazzottius varieornatus]